MLSIHAPRAATELNMHSVLASARAMQAKSAAIEHKANQLQHEVVHTEFEDYTKLLEVLRFCTTQSCSVALNAIMLS